MGPGNPWGVAFDDYGQSFVIDGAGGGISHLTPGTIPVKRRLNLQLIGKAGGYCGIECLGAGNLPEAIQGDFVIGDYQKNQVSRFSAIEDGAGFTVEWKKPLMRSSHRNFRPVDVKLGPDGAIYVVDWYNPITCHQDDFYRHPGRDMTQGRMLFESSRTGCMACHQVGEQGGQIGPDLTAVGSGTPFDGIVTEVLWPGRQVKAGFALTRVTMKDKRVFQGYIQPSRKKANLLLRDFSTGQIQAIPQQDIASTKTLGSSMPSTSQSLSRSELIDLLSYLFRLSG